MTSVISETVIFPSPILPVFAALTLTIDHDGCHFVRGEDHQHDLRQKVHGAFTAAINAVGMTLLPAESFDINDRNPGDANLGKLLLHIHKLEGLPDRLLGIKSHHHGFSSSLLKRRGGHVA